MIRRFTMIFAVMALALAVPAVASAGWQIVDLGVAGTSSYIRSSAINNLGNVAYTGVVGGASQAILYQKSNASTTNIGYLYATYPQSYAAGINDSNQVVGYSLAWFGGAVNNVKNHAFVWQPGSQITDLTPQELNSNWADMHGYGINASGQVTGDEYQDSRSDYQNAVIWDANAQLAKPYPPTTDAPTTWINMGSTTWYGTGINDSGKVIGSGKAGLTFKDFYYDGTTATAPWGDTAKYGWALNNAGIGVMATTAATYSYDGTNLVTLASTGGAGYQYAINNAATPQVVGTDGTTASIYTKVNSTTWSSQTVAAYAAGLGAQHKRWTSFSYADGINNSGEIVGYGTTGGVVHTFALLNIVPEPSTVLLAATALIGLLAYAWRKRK